MFELPDNPAADAIVSARNWARTRVTMSNQFDQSVVDNYQQQYLSWWGLEQRATIEEINAGLEQLGLTAVSILTKAGQYIAQIAASDPDRVPEKLLSAPYEYTVRNVVYQDGFRVDELPDLLQLWGLAQQHGLPTQATIFVSQLKEDWVNVEN